MTTSLRYRNSIRFSGVISILCLCRCQNDIRLRLTLPPLKVVERHLGMRQDALFVFLFDTLTVRTQLGLDELNLRCDVFIPLRNHIFVPLRNDAFIPFWDNTFLPLRNNMEVPLLLSTKEDRSRYFNSAVNVRFRTFDMRSNEGVGKRSLYRRDDVRVQHETPVFCQTAAYRGLVLCVLRTHGECIDGEREEEDFRKEVEEGLEI